MMIVCVLDGMSSPYSSSMILIIHACELLTPFRGGKFITIQMAPTVFTEYRKLSSSSPYSATEELN